MHDITCPNLNTSPFGTTYKSPKATSLSFKPEAHQRTNVPNPYPLPYLKNDLEPRQSTTSGLGMLLRPAVVLGRPGIGLSEVSG